MLRSFARKIGFLSASYFFLSINRFFNLKKFRIEDVKLNFLIIGAMKCGTSSLFDYLGEHEDVFITTIKEPGFFLPQDNTKYKPYYNATTYIRGYLSDKQLYKKLFKGFKGQKLRGEASTHYTKLPQFDYGIAERIAGYNPDMKLIYMVRDPYERMVSQFLHARRKGFTQTTLQKTLEFDDLYLELSLYHKQLKPYLNVFPREQILIVKFEDFIRSPHQEFKVVLSFLGLSGQLADQLKFEASNVSQNRASLQEEASIDNHSIIPELTKIKEDLLLFSQETGVDVYDWLASLDKKLNSVNN